jgi:hypothetical protein
LPSTRASLLPTQSAGSTRKRLPRGPAGQEISPSCLAYQTFARDRRSCALFLSHFCTPTGHKQRMNVEINFIAQRAVHLWLSANLPPARLCPRRAICPPIHFFCLANAPCFAERQTPTNLQFRASRALPSMFCPPGRSNLRLRLMRAGCSAGALLCVAFNSSIGRRPAKG